MSEHKRFAYQNKEEFLADIKEKDLNIPFSEDLSVLGEEVVIGDIKIPNRFVVHPMEGFDSTEDGSPGELCFRRYDRYAKGGSGLIWFEATAVEHKVRSNPRQLWMHEGNVDSYARLVEQTRITADKEFSHNPVCILQMTHSGRYSKPDGVAAPIIGHHSEVLDPRHNLPADYPLISDDELDGLQDKFVNMAKLAKQAGFDGVDMKSCHRYLLSELLAGHTREGKYGGSFENRTRFIRETIAKIMDAVKGIFVTSRINVYDAISYPYGWGVSKDDYMVPDLTDPIKLIGILEEMGIPMLNVSIGNPYFNPHFNRPYDKPIRGFHPPAEHPLEGVDRFIEITKTIQETFPNLPIIGSGYGWLRHFMPNVAAGIVQKGWVQLIGQGRGAFAYPDSVKDILTKGAMDPKKCCIACSNCTQIMRDGNMTGCVIRDGEIYMEQYKLGMK